MITQYNIPNTLTIKSDSKKIGLTQNVYNSLQCLTAITKRNLIKHDNLKIKTCVNIVEKIYSHGNDMVKTAVEDVFIRPLAGLFKSGGKKEQRAFQSLVSFSLK